MKIKPCPKCGSNDVSSRVNNLINTISIICNSCGGNSYDKYFSIMYWNMLSDYAKDQKSEWQIRTILDTMEEIKEEKKQKKLKPVNEACLGGEILTFDLNNNWKKEILVGICWDFETSEKCYEIKNDLGWRHFSYKVKRCPDVDYGDEDE